MLHLFSDITQTMVWPEGIEQGIWHIQIKMIKVLLFYYY